MIHVEGIRRSFGRPENLSRGFHEENRGRNQQKTKELFTDEVMKSDYGFCTAVERRTIVNILCPIDDWENVMKVCKDNQRIIDNPRSCA